MRGKNLLATFVLGVGALGIMLCPANPILAWSDEVWEINAYIGWEFLEMDRKVIFNQSGYAEYYPFHNEEREYMEKVETIPVKKLKERFETSFTPLIMVAYRKKNSEDTYCLMFDITCHADSCIYDIDLLGVFEYQYLSVRYAGLAEFHIPPKVEYTCFWLLPAESLMGEAYLRGRLVPGPHFRIQVKPSEFFINKYIEQLQKRIEAFERRVDELKRR